MRMFEMSFKDRLRHVDPILFLCSTLLSVISIMTIYGAVDNFGRSKLTMQLAMTAAGIFVLFVIANFDYRFFVDRFSMTMLIFSVLFLALYNPSA